MEKLFLYAIAASLIIPGTLFANGALPIEVELLPDLQGPHDFTPPGMHQLPSWNVKESEVELDKEPLKRQKFSLIPWSNLDPEEWLNVDRWFLERKIKDENPDWKLRLRDARQLEMVGKVLQCKGECPLYRGTMPANAQYLSRILEGDELRTEKDSVAWVFLMDGTLVRLGPESSISFQEINFSSSEVFHLVRLNHGHVFWHPSVRGEASVDFAPETDAHSLPLLLGEANLEFFQRKLFQSQTDREQLSEVMDLGDSAVKLQVKRLNKLRNEHATKKFVNTKVMMVAPNGTLVSKQVSFDMVSTLGGPGWFKRRSEGGELVLHLRGHMNKETTEVTTLNWWEIDPTGRHTVWLNDPPGSLQILELLTKRIQTLELAREIWIEKFSLPIFATLSDSKKLALEHGYALWGEESKRRFDFLVEYTRRIETTNLLSVKKLLEKYKEEGEVVELGVREGLYQHSLNRYLLGLKLKYDMKKNQVREMNELQYYVWTLKNGKK